MLFDQLDLFTQNYQRFTIEIIPVLEDNSSKKKLYQLYQTADYYHTAFRSLALEESDISPRFVEMSLKLKQTLGDLISHSESGSIGKGRGQL